MADLKTQIDEYIGLKSTGDRVVSANTRKTYVSLLNTLITMYNPKQKNLDTHILEWLHSAGDVMSFINKYLANKSKSYRETLLGVLFKITANPIYQIEMKKILKERDTEQKEQKKTETQAENWLTYDEVQAVVEDYKKRTKALITIGQKQQLDPQQLQAVQEYIILALTTGAYIPPRRSTDWTEFYLRNVDTRKSATKTYNYAKGNKLYFNVYKTAGTYGDQTVEMPNALKLLLNKWKKINPHDTLLIQTDGSKMSNVRLTQILNKIFQKNVSTSMLRHIYLTHHMGHLPKIREMEELAEQMGHSVGMQAKYIKH